MSNYFSQYGRPKKYKSTHELAQACENYFNSISYSQELEKDGKPLYNNNGEVLVQTIWINAPSIGNLCLFLDISEDTLLNYEKDLTFIEVIKKAKLIIKSWKINELNTRTTTTAGLKFDLINNYNWSDKQTIELGENTLNANMSAEEKVKALQEAGVLIDIADRQEVN